MNVLNIDELKSRLEKLRAQFDSIQKEMEEIGTLVVLADKYMPRSNPLPLRVDQGQVLMAIGNAIHNAANQTKNFRIISTCEEILSDGRRRLSRELVLELRERGVEVGGANPTKEAAALASYLAREKQKAVFVSDVKAGGWTLRRLLKKAKPGDAPTSPGLFSNGLVGHQGHTYSMLKEGAEIG